MEERRGFADSTIHNTEQFGGDLRGAPGASERITAQGKVIIIQPILLHIRFKFVATRHKVPRETLDAYVCFKDSKNGSEYLEDMRVLDAWEQDWQILMATDDPPSKPSTPVLAPDPRQLPPPTLKPNEPQKEASVSSPIPKRPEAVSTFTDRYLIQTPGIQQPPVTTGIVSTQVRPTINMGKISQELKIKTTQSPPQLIQLPPKPADTRQLPSSQYAPYPTNVQSPPPSYGAAGSRSNTPSASQIVYMDLKRYQAEKVRDDLPPYQTAKNILLNYYQVTPPIYLPAQILPFQTFSFVLFFIYFLKFLFSH